MFDFQLNGNPIPGIHSMDMDTFKTTFAFNSHRLYLLGGLLRAISAFKSLGIKFFYVDGSYTSKKELPGDYDVCYDIDNQTIAKLFFFYPIFRDFGNERARQKQVFFGEFFPSTFIARPPKEIYKDFFQRDKNDLPKGIIQLHF